MNCVKSQTFKIFKTEEVIYNNPNYFLIYFAFVYYTPLAQNYLYTSEDNNKNIYIIFNIKQII